ncbi:unannotated protein [freshwater metagenome]|uniref:Unannotated protein n=1 Tax=freshwater metagenome TaxID=449393 RepID=A0A6J7EDA0_9ZZZZ
MQGVLDREALAQELGVPGHLDPVGRDPLQALLDRRGSADRHRRLADDEGARLQVRGKALDRPEDLGHVGPLRPGKLRCAHADEVDVGELTGLRKRGGEPQPARLDVAGQDVAEAGLVEGHRAGLQDRDLGRVDIDPDDLVAELGHAGRVGRAEVAGTDDGQSQSHGPKGIAGADIGTATSTLEVWRTVSRREFADGARPGV